MGVGDPGALLRRPVDEAPDHPGRGQVQLLAIDGGQETVAEDLDHVGVLGRDVGRTFALGGEVGRENFRAVDRVPAGKRTAAGRTAR